MSGEQALKLMRQAQRTLKARRRCGEWLPGEPTLCAQRAGHTGKCGLRGQT